MIPQTTPPANVAALALPDQALPDQALPDQALRGLALFPSALSGAIYGTALNYRGALAALGDAMQAAPYLAPPRAPVLYIKPRNTWISAGAPIPVPSGHEAIVVGPSLAIVIGVAARRVSAAAALHHVAGYTIVNDAALPHDSYFRPAIQQQCRDGFCAIAPVMTQCQALPNTAELAIRVWIDDLLCLHSNTNQCIRSVSQLIADVSAFMTLHRGDLLLTGLPENLPLARAGQTVTIEVEGLGRLQNPVVNAVSALPNSALATPRAPL